MPRAPINTLIAKTEARCGSLVNDRKGKSRSPITGSRTKLEPEDPDT